MTPNASQWSRRVGLLSVFAGGSVLGCGLASLLGVTGRPAREVLELAPYLAALGGTFLILGVFLLAPHGNQPRLASAFASLSRDALLLALEETVPPLCICLDCRIVVPYLVALGRCPRCASTHACVEVFTPLDAQTVRGSLLA